jgi:hypothetical protein
LAAVTRQKRLGSGGCNFDENPARDARDADPVWSPEPLSVLRLIRDEESLGTLTFSVWKILGTKRIYHDGARLRVACRLGRRALRLSLSSSLDERAPFAYAVPSGARLRETFSLLSDFTTLMKSDAPFRSRRPPVVRPTRIAVMHMRALQALDGAQAGASQREIASVLFGEDMVAARWESDSELRAQVRHLIRRGRDYMRGGYRRLVTVDSGRQGDAPRTTESP